ncbi:MAG TPA: metallophosphoesterase, partial [Thermoanaerobaculia bacterium]|nr:metallophosphoesterase [Thermoanaerobaculia bacterium]
MRRRADMRCRERALAALLAGLIAVGASLGARAAGPDAEEAGATAAPRRLVAVGDVHGELDGLRAILRESGLLGEAGGWSGGAAVLVQTGDLLDRGAAVREVMDLLKGLQEAAAAGGGEVLVLTGNHESMNLLRALRDVAPEAFAAFADEGSDARRRAAFEQWQRWLGVHLERLGEEARAVAPAGEEQWLAAH